MGGAEVVFALMMASYSFIRSLIFVTFSVSCFQILFVGLVGLGFFGGCFLGIGGFLIVRCSINQYLGNCLVFLSHS